MKVCLTSFFVLISFVATATSIWNDGTYFWAYDVSGNEVTLSAPLLPQPSGSLKVPSEIDGKKVVAIGNGVFSSSEVLESVELPDNLTALGMYAFQGCSALKSVKFPKTLKMIDMMAFQGCSALEEVEFPASLQTIGSSAFSGCSALQAVEIQEGLLKIGSSAFRDCSALKSALLPDSLKEIGGYLFYSCPALKEIQIPSGMTSIPDGMFYQCAIETFEIPNTVTNIGVNAFYGCVNLKAALVPDSVQEIGLAAWGACASLTTVVLPASIKGFPKNGFSSCPAIRDVTYPPIVKMQDAFPAAFDQVVTATVANGSTNICDYAFLGCRKMTSVTIPDGVTSIGISAFEDCRYLTSLIIPATVERIGDYAFYGCGGLEELVYEGTKPELGIGIFTGTPLQGGGATVNVTSTNVVVHYVLNSIDPKFALPPSDETGFVNIITEVKGGCVAIPESWKDNYPSFVSKFGSDFSKALTMKTGKKDGAGNDMFVWQDYIAGTDPTDETSVFTASITIAEGKVTISYSPELDDARKAMRKYTNWGKKSLMDEKWMEVQEGHEAEYNFFKVSVEMR